MSGIAEAIAEINRRNAPADPEPEHCPKAPGHPSDPAFEPWHKPRQVGDYWECAHCRKELE